MLIWCETDQVNMVWRSQTLTIFSDVMGTWTQFARHMIFYFLLRSVYKPRIKLGQLGIFLLYSHYMKVKLWNVDKIHILKTSTMLVQSHYHLSCRVLKNQGFTILRSIIDRAELHILRGRDIRGKSYFARNNK
jgi:hypothetical protein